MSVEAVQERLIWEVVTFVIAEVPGTEGAVVSLKVAVTVMAEFMVTVQVLVPEQPPPDQPAKVAPVEGAAVRVTLVPEAYE